MHRIQLKPLAQLRSSAKFTSAKCCTNSHPPHIHGFVSDTTNWRTLSKAHCTLFTCVYFRHGYYVICALRLLLGAGNFCVSTKKIEIGKQKTLCEEDELILIERERGRTRRTASERLNINYECRSLANIWINRVKKKHTCRSIYSGGHRTRNAFWEIKHKSNCNKSNTI